MRSSCAFCWLRLSLFLKVLEMIKLPWPYRKTAGCSSALSREAQKHQPGRWRVYFLSWWILFLVYRHRSDSNWSCGCLCLKNGKCGKVINILREITVSPIPFFDCYDLWPFWASVSRSEKLEKKISVAMLLVLWHKKNQALFLWGTLENRSDDQLLTLHLLYVLIYPPVFALLCFLFSLPSSPCNFFVQRIKFHLRELWERQLSDWPLPVQMLWIYGAFLPPRRRRPG